MEIYQNLSTSNRYTISKFLSKQDIFQIITLIDKTYFQFSYNTNLEMLIDFPEVCKWMNRLKTFESPEILEKDEFYALKKYRCMYCKNKSSRCAICQHARNKIRNTKNKINKLRNRQNQYDDYEINKCYLFHELEESINDLYNELNEMYLRWEY